MFVNQKRFFHRARLFAALAIAIFTILSGCISVREEVPTPTPGGPLVTFVARVKTTADDKVWIEYGIHNGGGPQPADNDFAGRLELHGPQGLRAAVDAHQRGRLLGGQYTPLGSWESRLAPGKYEIIWGAPGYGSTRVVFTLETRQGEAVIDHQETLISPHYPPES